MLVPFSAVFFPLPNAEERGIDAFFLISYVGSEVCPGIWCCIILQTMQLSGGIFQPNPGLVEFSPVLFDDDDCLVALMQHQ